METDPAGRWHALVALAASSVLSMGAWFSASAVSTTARAMAFVSGRGRLDDDFCAAGIRSRMFALGLAESCGLGAATAADVDWSVRDGGD